MAASKRDCPRPFNNSQAWLSGPRRGNVNVSQALLHDLLIDDASPEPKLKRTICFETSSFLQGTNNNFSLVEEEWKDKAFRLTYLAIHEHQHKHARKEALLRVQCNQETMDNIGNFDHECPDAKFIVSTLPND